MLGKGEQLFYGLGGKQNVDKARYCFEEAIEKYNHPVAMVYLADTYNYSHLYSCLYLVIVLVRVTSLYLVSIFVGGVTS